MTSAPLELNEIERIGAERDAASAPSLLQCLAHPDAVFRRAAAAALGRVTADYALYDLAKLLKDPAPEVRQSAAWALGQIKSQRASPGLLAALDDPDPATRRAAIWALGRIGERRAIPQLEAAVRADPRESVRRAASAALATLRDSAGQQPRQNSPSPTRRSGGKRLAWLALTVGLLGVALTAGALAWAQPLGPRLVVQTAATSPVALGPPALAAQAPHCGGPPTMLLLLAGVDSGTAGFDAGSTDVIRVARLDFVYPSAILLAIPRDLWVTIPGLQAKGISENRIKTAFPYGNFHQTPGGGMSLLAQTLLVNFGLTVDHYAVIDFQGFAQGVDAIGGIDIDLAEPVGDPNGALYFPAGPQHLDGRRALEYARVRPDNSSDVHRIDRQTQVIMAARDKALSPEGGPGLPSLVASMQAATRTDLSPAQIASLICLAQAMPRSGLTTLTLSSKFYVVAHDSFGFERFLPDTAAIREAMAAFMRGDLTPLRDAEGD